jgi:hypothetical protein
MMGLPRVRFTVRRLMIAVAVVAVLIGAGLQIRRAIRLCRLSAEYAQQAAKYAEFETTWRQSERHHREREQELRKLVDDTRQGVGGPEFWRQQAKGESDEAEKLKSLAEFHANMKSKHQAAARRPWIEVEPCPPWPEL